ncbi:HD domain-containing protein [Halobacillus sp. BBL2006]|uniref:HD domain-containing protein n=1 Tax=Halobacillus sp. BBL2006 TaxID=1543706 RepID=UPI00054432DD|nr:HD domain-containing protein [Halobacillus sp. BBL2006]KHE71653.1 hypothetical protein LD39_08705 [Halobacillus sp. BBL2006]
MNQKEALQKIKQFVHSHFSSEPSGHDFTHMERVARWSSDLAANEGADPFLCEVIGWLHDIGDRKLFKDPVHAKEEQNRLLKELGFKERVIADINEAIDTVSFHKGQVPDSITGKIVQDADRLDAVGAIGIARTFAFGGAKGQQIVSKNEMAPNSLQHFYDKLLKLAPLMNTESGRQEAERRHQFMLLFLEEFQRETEVQP